MILISAAGEDARMSIATLVLLALVAVVGLVLVALGERFRPPWGAVVLGGGLAVAGVLAWASGRPADGVVEGAALAAVLAAMAGGGPVATAVLQMADPHGVTARWAEAVGPALPDGAAQAAHPVPRPRGPADPDILRGGAWIGVLERAAVAGTLLAGWPEGLAVVLAIKGLGRYNELRSTPAAAERFIIGSLASGLWAVACVGVAVLLRS
jgi:hypothetical protein